MNKAVIRPGSPEDLPALLALSAEWAAENITYGYYANSEKEFLEYRTWVAELDGVVIGYAAGQMETAQRESSLQKAGDQWFELEELYVTREYRSLDVGRQMLDYLEETLRREDCRRLMLTGANRDAGPLMRFYAENGMKTYSFRMFKNL